MGKRHDPLQGKSSPEILLMIRIETTEISMVISTYH